MGPLVALGIGLIPGILGALFGQKEAPPPPPDNTPALLKAMQDQRDQDMATINKLIDRLDAHNQGHHSQIGLPGDTTAAQAGGPASPASPTAGAAATDAANPANPANPGDPAKPADPARPRHPFREKLFGILQDLVKLAQQLTDIVSRLIPGQKPEPQPAPQPAPAPAPQPDPVAAPGLVPLKAEAPKAA